MTSQRFIVILAVGLLACSDEAPPPDSPEVQVSGVVRDPDGKPVSGVTVIWEAWPLPDSAQQGGGSSSSVRWFAKTDSAGRFAEHVGYYSVAQLDSLVIEVGVDGCWGFAPLTVRERAVTLSPTPLGSRLNREFTLTRTGPRARLVVGPMCAVMVGPPPFEEEDRFAVWIDDISDSVRGRWFINYQGSRGGDYGYFAGVRAGNVLTLDLQHATPWDNCTGYTLELPVEVDDTLGTGTYRSPGCPTVPTELHFTEGESLTWPFP